MRTQNIPVLNIKKENHPKLSKICSYGIFFKGLKNKFETAVVNEPSVFEPLKLYCTYIHVMLLDVSIEFSSSYEVSMLLNSVLLRPGSF